jgi:hypothetical protein
METINKKIEKALKTFEEEAKKHAECTEKGNYKSGNICYSKIVKSVSVLRNENLVSKLSIFLNSSSIGVRLWSATFLLPINEKDSLRVLEEITKNLDIHSSTAKYTLSEWRLGNLKL